MSRKELPRPGLIKAASNGRITKRQAAQALHLSLRQVRRLKRRFEAEGREALRHSEPGPALAPPAAASRCRSRAGAHEDPVRGLQRSHLTEKLREHHRLTDLAGIRAAPAPEQLGLAPQHGRRRAPRPPPSRPPRPPRGACAARRQPLRLAGGPGPASRCWAPSTTPRPRSWPCSSARPRISMATPRSSSSCSHPRRAPGLYGDRLNLLVRNDPHWSPRGKLAGAPSPPTSGACCRARHRLHRRPLAPGQRPHRTALGDLAGSPVSELRLRGIASARRPTPSCRSSSPISIGASAGPRPRRARLAPAPAISTARELPLSRVVARDNTVQLGPRWVQLRRPRSFAGSASTPRAPRWPPRRALQEGRSSGPRRRPPLRFTLGPRRPPSTSAGAGAPGRAPLHRPRRRLLAPRRKPTPAATPCRPYPWVIAKDRHPPPRKAPG